MYKKVILILIIVLIPRIPFLVIAGPSFNDPFQDAAQYYLLAKSIKDGKGLTVDYAANFFNWEGFKDKEEITRNYWLPIGYPLFLSLALVIYESIFTAMIFQVILTFFLSLLMYFFFRKIFDETISLFSVFIISLMPEFLVLSRIPFTEVIYMIFILLSISIIIKNKDKLSFIILAGITSTYAFYIRFPGLILIASVFIWLIINKKYLNSAYYALTCLICIVPLLCINYYYHNDIFAFLKMTNSFPPASEVAGNITDHSSKSKIVQMFSSSNMHILSFNSVGFMFILFPFGIISFLSIKKNNYHCLVFLFLIFSILFHVFFLSFSESRYFLPLALLLIPMSLNSLKNISGFISQNSSFKNLQITFYLISSLVIIMYGLDFLNELYDKRSAKSEDFKNYEWIKNNAKREDNILVYHPYRCNYFTGNKSITFPQNLNEEYFRTFVDIYDIKYIQTRKSNTEENKKNEFYKNTIFSFKDTIKLKGITLEKKDYQNRYGTGKADEVYTYIIKKENY